MRHGLACPVCQALWNPHSAPVRRNCLLNLTASFCHCTLPDRSSWPLLRCHGSSGPLACKQGTPMLAYIKREGYKSRRSWASPAKSHLSPFYLNYCMDCINGLSVLQSASNVQMYPHWGSPSPSVLYRFIPVFVSPISSALIADRILELTRSFVLWNNRIFILEQTTPTRLSQCTYL